MRRHLYLLVPLLSITTGCSGGSSDLSPAKDKELRNAFSRALTPEEVAKLKGGSGAGPMAMPPRKGQ